MFRRPLFLLPLAAAITLASCSTGESAAPGLEGSPDLAPSGQQQDPEVSEDESVTEQIGDDANVESSDSEDLADPTSEPVLTLSTDAATDAETPAPPDASTAPAEAVCASLNADGYETRKATLRAADDDIRQDVEDMCPEALARTEDAREIEQRVASFNTGEAPLTATDLVCSGNEFSVRLTNQADHPIGVHAALRLTAEGIEGPLGSTREPLVIWSLEPATSTVLEGTFEANRATSASLECEVEIRVFDATPTDADASLGSTIIPQLAVDDVALWLPYLVALAEVSYGSGIPDFAAALEDVRSPEYPNVLAGVSSSDTAAPDTGVISVCSESIDRPDDRLISLVYFEELADTSHLRHALFRRGNDDQWRWLSSSAYFDSQDYWNCGTPSINL